MGRITITIDDKLEKRFREAVSKIFGFKRGNLQAAIEQALRMWIEKKESKR